mmetsp:Transcript_43301/g.41697  ORF Transcript_43301/g.41697 Transcript_43301/m.41697 type:complete len:100 (-) Transcript_43301:45-344(-)
MGYMDFNGVRYMDARNTDRFYFPISQLELDTVLPSDSRIRLDARTLQGGNIEAAQAEKEKLEELQRKDRRLREAADKRREKGGPLLDLKTMREKGEAKK